MAEQQTYQVNLYQTIKMLLHVLRKLGVLPIFVEEFCTYPYYKCDKQDFVMTLLERIVSVLTNGGAYMTVYIVRPGGSNDYIIPPSSMLFNASLTFSWCHSKHKYTFWSEIYLKACVIERDETPHSLCVVCDTIKFKDRWRQSLWKYN